MINAAQHSTKADDIALLVVGSDDAIAIKVSNYGPVIPEESLKTIFEPLIQLEPDVEEDTRPKTSLGLGLFIAQEIILAHNGAITVTSNANDGTVFSVKLPRNN